MFAVPVMGIGEKLFSAFPILHAHHDAAGDEVAQPQQPGFWLARQLRPHARHGHRHWPPAVNRQKIVDAYSDQEQRKGLLGWAC